MAAGSQDPALLDRLATEKLQAEAETMPPRAGSGSRSPSTSPMATPPVCAASTGETVELTRGGAGDVRRAEGRIRQARGANTHDADELPDEVDQRLGEIETALAAFENRPVRL